jgi:hypothetical protein
MTTHKCDNLELIQDIKKDIYGNGKPGIKDKISNLDKRIDVLKTEFVGYKKTISLKFYGLYSLQSIIISLLIYLTYKAQ